ncbi:Galactosylgalactosylxylosylprotein 3-beta-glucuronosyltransferase [Aphelenchoides bicaudatus]|nr:Galactosylgalactosylxylosylprotein 3-beta-glucuronosyltransferase [Aphelenchoides bicaudatus]
MRLIKLTLCWALLCLVVTCAPPPTDNDTSKAATDTTIFIITPTHKRPERLADMTRFSQTLMHVPDIVWIVVEDDLKTSPAVEAVLEAKPYTLWRGWTHRNYALDYLRTKYRNYDRNAVVYFADDDNSYDIRLFNDYIRKVETIGVWAVGLSGGAKVEAPHVENGVIKSWDAVYSPGRAYAVDMAGFAVNLKQILKSDASFGKQCIGHDPEDCFLQQFKIPKKDAKPFGWDSNPKEILVWHTRTSPTNVDGGDYGYVFEANPEKPKKKT